MENEKNSNINEDEKVKKNTKVKGEKSTTKKGTTAKKSTTAKKDSATKKSATSKKSSTTKKSDTEKKSTATKKKTTTKKGTTAKKSSTTKKSTTEKKSTTTKKNSATKKSTTSKKSSTTKKKTKDKELDIEKNDEIGILEEIQEELHDIAQEAENEEIEQILNEIQEKEQKEEQTEEQAEEQEETQEQEEQEKIQEIEQEKKISKIEKTKEKSKEKRDSKANKEDKIKEENKTNVDQPKLRGVSLVWLIAMIIVAIVFFNSFYNICKILLGYQKIQKENDDLINDFTYVEETDNFTSDGEENTTSAEAQQGNEISGKIEGLKVKWDEIKKINKEVCGWIVISGTNINYPVLKSEVSDKYLTTNIYGEYSKGGCIFVDSQTLQPFSVNNTIVYGHNLNSGDMFSDLKKYGDESFAKSHDKINIILENNEVKTYQIFAFYEINADNFEIYNTNVTDLNNYYNLIKNNNKINIVKDINTTKQILTLSTCTNYDEGTRFIVQAFCED